MKRIPIGFLLALLLGCNTVASQNGTQAVSTAASGGSCQEREDAAKKAILAAAEGGKACAGDADCSVVELRSSCSDGCSRAVSAQGAAAVKAAAERLDGSTCAQFVKDGCSVHHPPCAPPGPARCTAGVCSN